MEWYQFVQAFNECETEQCLQEVLHECYHTERYEICNELFEERARELED